jgi:predicted dienelactone hydrolase
MKPTTKSNRFHSAAICCALLLAFIACNKDGGTEPEEPDEGAYKSPNTYQVAVFDNYTVRDATRNRNIPILIRYPRSAPSPLPVILWSHGGGANPDGQKSYNEWGDALAAAGYAVIHMAHVDDKYDAHCAVLGIPASECEPVDFTKEVSEGGTLGVLWYNRPRDASAVVNDFAGIENASGLKFDRNRIASAGHSGGAHTVMNLAGAFVDFSPSVRNVQSFDRRFSAFLACSPQGIGRLGMTATSWNNISVPVMVETGAADNAANENAADRLDPFKHMPRPDKYLTYLDSPNANHGTFGLNPNTGDVTLEPYVSAAGLAFFDAYLRNLSAARTWLTSNKISAWSRGVATITVK